MAELNNSRFGDLCRLCAAKTGMFQAINIFESEGALRQISKKIETCLPVQVHEADQLPKMVCENCLYKLELFCEFRDRTIKTERLLIDLYKEINTTQSAINVVIHQNELIMVQHLNEANLDNVNELDLGHLDEHREGTILEHGMILRHHLLNGIDLNNHDLTSQDLSNHSLQTGETIMVDTSSHSMDNLSLIPHEDHELLTEQFQLEQELQQHVGVGLTDENSVVGPDLNNIDSVEDSYHSFQDDDPLKDPLNYENKNDLVDNVAHLTETPKNIKRESMQHDDSTSDNSLLIDEDNNLNTHSVDNKQVFIIEQESTSNSVQLTDEFYCNICNKGFSLKNDFQNHYETHFFNCSICLAMFTNLEVLNTHRKEAHGTSIEEPKNQPAAKSRLKPEKSDVTNDSINSDESDLDNGNDNEIINEEDVDDPTTPENGNSKRKKLPPKVCKECGKSFKTNYKLTEHMRKHTGETPYKCNSCEKAFRSKIGLAQHEAKHTGQYDFSCPTCGKGFQCKSYLMVHQRVHSDVKPFPCTTCGQNFKTKQSLLDHTNRHLGVKPYMCEICGRGFITKGLCKGHQRVHSGVDNRKYSCKICNKMFVSKSYLQTHLLIHTGEKPFMCEVCGKGFLTRVDLRIHSTMHTGEKSYVCEVCGKAFARRDALRCHRRSHTGERPYSCDLCGQTFTQFTPMAIHKRLHTGERPYSCETCGKTFISRSTMIAHSKKHVR